MAEASHQSKSVRMSKSIMESQNSDPDLANRHRETLNLMGTRIVQVIAPTTICCIYVAILIRLLEDNNSRRLNMMHNFFSKMGLSSGKDANFSEALVTNALIVVVFALLIILITLIILVVLYLGWHKCLAYYFYLPSLIIMSILTPIYLRGLLQTHNIGLDYFSTVFIVWNFSALGLISIFETCLVAPKVLQQFYLIHNSSMVALLIIDSLPSWAPWLLLFFLIGWDLFAVLASCGPLNLIIGMAEKNGLIEMPGLIYTTETTMIPDRELEEEPCNDESTPSFKNNIQKNQPQMSMKTEAIAIERAPEIRSEKSRPVRKELGEDTDTNMDSKSIASGERRALFDRGINIGLGDFIFCSLLIGLTSRGENGENLYASLATLNAIQIGLIATLVLLAVNNRALPALPISIVIGMLAALGTFLFAPELSNELATNQIFI